MYLFQFFSYFQKCFCGVNLMKCVPVRSSCDRTGVHEILKLENLKSSVGYPKVVKRD